MWAWAWAWAGVVGKVEEAGGGRKRKGEYVRGERPAGGVLVWCDLDGLRVGLDWRLGRLGPIWRNAGRGGAGGGERGDALEDGLAEAHEAESAESSAKRRGGRSALGQASGVQRGRRRAPVHFHFLRAALRTSGACRPRDRRPHPTASLLSPTHVIEFCPFQDTWPRRHHQPSSSTLPPPSTSKYAVYRGTLFLPIRFPLDTRMVASTSEYEGNTQCHSTSQHRRRTNVHNTNQLQKGIRYT